MAGGWGSEVLAGGWGSEVLAGGWGSAANLPSISMEGLLSWCGPGSRSMAQANLEWTSVMPLDPVPSVLNPVPSMLDPVPSNPPHTGPESHNPSQPQPTPANPGPPSTLKLPPLPPGLACPPLLLLC